MNKFFHYKLICTVLLFSLIGCGLQGEKSESTSNSTEEGTSQVENLNLQNPADNEESEIKLGKTSAGLFNFIDKLEVKAGQTLTITPDNKYIITREWIMEDGAKINFAPDVTTFVVNAEEVKWGDDVIIDARGKNGSNGANGSNGVGGSETGDCSTGNPGGNASSASDGSDAVSLDFTIGISSLGSARILANGGSGGNGGKGGNGVSGTKGDCSDSCNGGNGGNAGSGGNGGDSGDGGDVSIGYKFLDTGLDIGAIVVEVKAGEVGKAGDPGVPGNEGPGSKCIFPTKHRSGGKRGLVPATASKGQSGIDGRYRPIRITSS